MELKGFPDFMFPNDTPGSVEIDEFEAKAICILVHGEDESTLQTGIGPAIRIWVRVIDSCKTCSKDFVGGARDSRFDTGFVLRGEGRDRRHYW